MDLLVIGGSGLLGREITRQALGSGLRVATTHYRGVADSYFLDIRDRVAVRALVDQLRPAAIVNAAFQQADWATTADGAAHVAAAAVSAGARLVHLSSDAVFSGLAPSYDEACLPDPVVPYGAAKAAAETAVKVLDPGAVIVRTSLIIGNGSSVHERFVHGLVSGTASGVLFTDDVRCPVHVSDLAAAVLELAGSSYSGVHHVAGPSAVSRYELGVLIARRDDLPTGLRAQSGLPGPLVVRLDCTMTQSRLSTRLRGVHEFLASSRPSHDGWMSDNVLADQVDYYRRRAGEYDETAYGDVPAARTRIARLVAEMRPTGRVLEIACGTGLWTEALVAHAGSVTALDAAPETVEIARKRVPAASFEVADVFSWAPASRYDVVFFSAWLSHVPAGRFNEFWQLLRDLLTEGGRVLFIDEHVDERAKEAYVAGRDEIVERRLNDGRTFRVVKNFVDPDVLVPRLAQLGWECTIHRDGRDWVRGEARLA